MVPFTFARSTWAKTGTESNENMQISFRVLGTLFPCVALFVLLRYLPSLGLIPAEGEGGLSS